MSDQREVGEALVRELLATQRPEWSDLPLSRLSHAGTDNAIYRLGHDKLVRLPRAVWSADHAEKEVRWLPQLAPHLPLAVPEPLFLGHAAGDYPWRWSVLRWLPGEAGERDQLGSDQTAASTLGGFVCALGEVDASEGPRSGQQNSYRGVSLAALDPGVRKALSQLDGRVQVAAAEAAWAAALDAPLRAGPRRWVHGDLHAGNLLTTEGRLSAVIDFGLLGVGDPAVDFAAGWTVFRGDAREAFRIAAGADAASWARGRGWALYAGLIALPYYWDTNPTLIASCLATVAEVLRDPA